MTRKWEFGGVALVTGEWHRDAVAETRAAVRHADGWQAFDNGAYLYLSDVTHVRPLAVIDPESEADCRRAMDAFSDAWLTSTLGRGERWKIMQHALREFADPTTVCGASLTLGDAGQLFRCGAGLGHEGPHIDGTRRWTAQPAPSDAELAKLDQGEDVLA